MQYSLNFGLLFSTVIVSWCPLLRITWNVVDSFDLANNPASNPTGPKTALPSNPLPIAEPIFLWLVCEIIIVFLIPVGFIYLLVSFAFFIALETKSFTSFSSQLNFNLTSDTDFETSKLLFIIISSIGSWVFHHFQNFHMHY